MLVPGGRKIGASRLWANTWYLIRSTVSEPVSLSANISGDGPSLSFRFGGGSADLVPKSSFSWLCEEPGTIAGRFLNLLELVRPAAPSCFLMGIASSALFKCVWLLLRPVLTCLVRVPGSEVGAVFGRLTPCSACENSNLVVVCIIVCPGWPHEGKYDEAAMGVALLPGKSDINWTCSSTILALV
jgi:hypothetical protein